MLTPWEIKKKGYIPPLIMVQLDIMGGFALFKVLLKNFGAIKKMQGLQKNVHIRPKRMYDLPKYRPGMKYCDLDEQYLRPTLYCNCRAPEIIAMAHQLGAYKKSDYEFAQAAFDFVKRKVILEIMPMDDAVEVLKRGTGTCLHEISLFIALCRAAGIKARYKMYALTMLEEWMQPAVEHAPLMKQWYDAMGFFLMHGEGEAYVDGKWLPADVGPTPWRQASSGVPITKFGEDSIGVWLFPIPGTIIIRESIPLGFGTASRILMKRLVPNSVAGINIGILEQIERGKKVIEAAGGEENYDKHARQKSRPKMPTVKLDKHKKIVFVD